MTNTLQWTAQKAGAAVSDALRDVAAERRRQIESEGWTPEHDDEHYDGSMARAAAAYALVGSSDGRVVGDELQPSLVERCWPWHRDWWKPSHRRHNLVRAAALLLAEIERLDRAARREGASGAGAAPD